MGAVGDRAQAVLDVGAVEGLGAVVVRDGVAEAIAHGGQGPGVHAERDLDDRVALAAVGGDRAVVATHFEAEARGADRRAVLGAGDHRGAREVVAARPVARAGLERRAGHELEARAVEAQGVGGVHADRRELAVVGEGVGAAGDRGRAAEGPADAEGAVAGLAGVGEAEGGLEAAGGGGELEGDREIRRAVGVDLEAAGEGADGRGGRALGLGARRGTGPQRGEGGAGELRCGEGSVRKAEPAREREEDREGAQAGHGRIHARGVRCSLSLILRPG